MTSSDSVASKEMIGGSFSENPRVEQRSIKWQVTAVVVGALIASGVGGFGIYGLLHTYGIVAASGGMASAIGTIGHTPYAWSLWALTIGGLASGSALITYGILKLPKKTATHTKTEPIPDPSENMDNEVNNEVDNEVDNEGNSDKENGLHTDQSDSVNSNLKPDNSWKKQFQKDNFSKIQIVENDFQFLKDEITPTFSYLTRNNSVYIVIKNDKGKLKCTPLLEQSVGDGLVKKLRQLDYTRMKKPKTSRKS